MKDKIIIPIHSILDLITNSSTELFIIDEDKGVEIVRQVVNELYNKYGNELYNKYGEYEGYGGPEVCLENPTYYVDTDFSYIEDEDMVKWLDEKTRTI